MSNSRHYDTVAFDVRDNATMLFFAKTTDTGDIQDYLLLVRTIEDDFDETMYIEINDKQFGGSDVLESAELIGNSLKLAFSEPVDVLDGASELALTFSETPENLQGIEVGAFRVLGDVLKGWQCLIDAQEISGVYETRDERLAPGIDALQSLYLALQRWDALHGYRHRCEPSPRGTSQRHARRQVFAGSPSRRARIRVQCWRSRLGTAARVPCETNEP